MSTVETLRITICSHNAVLDVRGKIALGRYSVPYSYRGFKAQTAQRRGVAALN